MKNFLNILILTLITGSLVAQTYIQVPTGSGTSWENKKIEIDQEALTGGINMEGVLREGMSLDYTVLDSTVQESVDNHRLPVYKSDGGLKGYIRIQRSAVAGTVMVRDSGGRSKVADPVEPDDVATKGYVDAHAGGKYAKITISIPFGTGWTDFELKASRDNFVDDGENMVFFYHSPDPTKSVVSQVWTNKPDVYFTDSGKTGTPNRRGWISQGTNSIYNSLVDANSEVGGIVVYVRDDLSGDKDHLVWSYNLGDGTTWEEDGAGRTIWRNDAIVQWVNEFDPNP